MDVSHGSSNCIILRNCLPFSVVVAPFYNPLTMYKDRNFSLSSSILIYFVLFLFDYIVELWNPDETA